MGPDGAFGFLFAAFCAIVLIAAWVILAGSRFVQGGVVERPERVPQLYGYTACLIGLVWALTSAITAIDEALTLSAPELRPSMEFGMEPSVTSFEAFRVTYDRMRQMGGPSSAEMKPDTTPETEMRRRYEAMRADRIRRSTVEAQRRIVVASVSFVLASLLFLFHWRWLRKRALVVAG